MILFCRSKVIFKVKRSFPGAKMAARYFKVKYDFSTNGARDKYNTSFLCDFDREIHFV